MEDDKLVTISAKEYNKLRHDSDFLKLLHKSGVEFWEGYDDFEAPDENYDYSSEIK